MIQPYIFSHGSDPADGRSKYRHLGAWSDWWTNDDCSPVQMGQGSGSSRSGTRAIQEDDFGFGKNQRSPREFIQYSYSREYTLVVPYCDPAGEVVMRHALQVVQDIWCAISGKCGPRQPTIEDDPYLSWMAETEARANKQLTVVTRRQNIYEKHLKQSHEELSQ